MSSSGSGQRRRASAARSGPLHQNAGRSSGGGRSQRPTPSGDRPQLLLTLFSLGLLGLLFNRCAQGSVNGWLDDSSGQPPCGEPLNIWAREQLQASRARLEEENNVRRIDSPEGNAVTRALIWVDGRIIDQRLEPERQRLRRDLLAKHRCLPAFDP